MEKPKIRFKGYQEDWEQRKLGEYVNITSGEAPSKFEEGTELYVKVDDLNYNDKYVVDTQNKVAEHSTVKRVTKGSVVFPKRGAAIMTNKVRIMGIDSYMDTNMMALTSEKLDSEFLYNIISKEGLYKIADTSTIPQINNKHVEPYEVTIPSLDEQRRIGAYFKQLDDFITLHQRKCEEMKTLKKYMLQKMFPQNGQSVPQIRFSGFTEDWEQRKLGEVCSEIGDGLHSAPEYDDNGKFYFINGNNLINGHIVINSKETKRVSEKTFEKNNKQLDDNTVLLSINGTIGNLAYYQGEPVMLGKSAAYLKANKIDKTFLYSLLQTTAVMNNFMLFLTGTTIKNLGLDAIKNTKISIPELHEQKKIGLYFSQLDHLITLHQQKCDELRNIKKFMLQNMFI